MRNQQRSRDAERTDDYVEVTDAVGQPLGWLEIDGQEHPAGAASDMPRERWRLFAACRNLPTSLFFSDDPADQAEAITTCATCRVSEACLAYAVDHAEFGIWGGRTPDERKKIKRRARRTRTA